MRQVVCPIALHPEGAPQRIAAFTHPQAGWQLVKGGLSPGEDPARGCARELYEESGLETRAALLIGSSKQIQPKANWHFALCRFAPPVRNRWQHLCADDGGHLFRFHWHPLDAAPPSDTNPIFQRALNWIKTQL